MSYQTSSKRSQPFWLLIGARKLLCFSSQSEARMAATVWNWCGKTSSLGALFAVLYFSSCHIFPPVQTFPHPHYLSLGLRGCGAPMGKKIWYSMHPSNFGSEEIVRTGVRPYLRPPVHVSRDPILHFKHPRVSAVNRIASRSFGDKNNNNKSRFFLSA